MLSSSDELRVNNMSIKQQLIEILIEDFLKNTGCE